MTCDPTSVDLNFPPFQILEGMGLGPKGPPIPAPVTLQVYPYPLKRRRLDSTANERFVFIAASPSDP